MFRELCLAWGLGPQEAAEDGWGGGTTQDTGTDVAPDRQVGSVKACVRSSKEADTAVLRLFRTQLAAVLIRSEEHISVHMPVLGLVSLPPGWGCPEDPLRLSHLSLTHWSETLLPTKKT